MSDHYDMMSLEELLAECRKRGIFPSDENERS
jgi:hypothetical protein